MNYSEKYQKWLSFADEETKAELLSIEKEEKEIEDRFYKDLAFGTGGLRGVMGTIPGISKRLIFLTTQFLNNKASGFLFDV